MKDFPIDPLPTDMPHWSENYALGGFDPVAGIDAFLALGRWRHDLSIWREMITIALPDGTVLAHRAVGNAMAGPKGPGGSNMAIEITEDGHRQSWRFLGGVRRVPAASLKDDILRDGPLLRCEFSFDFESRLPHWMLGAGKKSAVAGHAHLEQIGRTRAEIRVGSETFRFDSEMNRDHSQGPRLVGAVTRHAWFHGILDNGLRFQAYEMFEGDETGTPRFSQASVIRDGVPIPAVMRFGPPLPDAAPLDHAHDPVRIRFDYGGETLDLVAESYPTTIHVQMTAPWDNYIGGRQIGTEPSRRLVEQSVRWRTSDGVGGYGHLERTVPGRILADDELGFSTSTVRM